jgi:Tfp pilus assembly protein PilX
MAMTQTQACKMLLCLHSRVTGWQKQSGMVLLLSIALLAGLSLLAILAASSMLQQQHMAANHADGELARLSAITAVGMGERYILDLPDTVRAGNCQSDCFEEPARAAILAAGTLPRNPESLDDDWWLSWGHTSGSPTPPANTDGDNESTWALPGRHQPMFIIEELEYLAASGFEGSLNNEEEAPNINGVAYYRIFGRGTGNAASSTHVAESILARPWRPTSSAGESNALDCTTLRTWYDCGRMAYRERR